ncbi:MAG: PDZ domain-containing protein, partial [Sphingobacterium thalpophilum]
HIWNVKRLRPIALGPFNYEQENYTRNLWISEGFTAYYQDIYTKRAGLQSPDRYLTSLAASISSVENQPGNRVEAVSDASFDAWIKQYRPNENSANSTISYYSKGALMALIMDLETIHSSQAKVGLDEVMKSMYDQYYSKLNRGFTDAEFKSTLEKIAGKSFDDVYKDYVNGVKTIDYNKYFGYAGFTLIDDAAKGNEAYLGAGTALKDGKIMVTNIVRQSPAWISGLNVNDEILSIDGSRINNVADPRLSELERFLSNKKPGDKLLISINRDGLIRQIELTLIRNPNHKFRIASLPDLSDAQIAVRKRWLRL